ncbi:MAG: hypothetical protein KGL10_01580 [Alphaproteobacteria bacterium]|nr:hypothetical protein [Alphaproteobacteria bacterium]MDE2335978.1 hypothetical protein [Alphaproteobacteria bacterium]
MPEKRDAKRAKENAEIFARLKQYADDVAQARADAGALADPAKKILALLELQDKIYHAKQDMRHLEERLVRKRAGRSVTTIAKRTILTALSLPVITLAATIEADWTAKGSQRKEKKKLRGAVDIAALEQKMGEEQKDAARALEETVMLCDLQLLSVSPHFATAYKVHEPLRDRFEAAAAARAALGDKPAVSNGDKPVAPERKKPAAGKTPAKKSVGSYDRLKKGI